MSAQRRSDGRGGTASTKRKAGGPAPDWSFRLYVAGNSPRSQAAFTNLKRLCDAHLPGAYQIEVIDLLKNPHLAKADQVLAIPTLVRKVPEPVKRVIGDLSNADRAMVLLNVGPGESL